MKKTILLNLVLLLVTSALAPAATHLVPEHFPTIQDAIDAAADFDVVLVAPGTYTGPGNRDIDFLGKAITVRSTDPNDPNIVAVTIIDCENSGLGFYFQNGEDANSVLAGLTITNGHGYYYGGAVSCRNGSPTIANCIISNNTGSGILCEDRDTVTTITNCTIIGNGGAGIAFVKSSGTITDCTIAENGYAGIYCYGYATITNCTIVGNKQAGIANAYSPKITNCVIWGNSESEIEGSAVITYSNVQGGWPGEGNIDEEPRFAFSTDYHLMPDSACIDAGTNTPIGGLPTTDIDGNPRSLDGNDDGTAVVDMGAYEYNPHSPSIAVSSVSFYYVQGDPKPAPQTLLIRNCGGGTLNWEIIEDCNWLEAVPTNGVSTDQIDEVVLMVDPNSLAPGDYRCMLRVLDPNAVNSPVTVQVPLHVGVILRVPEHFPTIQAAIDAAVDYDVVLVADGIYTGDGNRDIRFRGKTITVRSENGPDSTIIDCENTNYGFRFDNSETSDACLEGFTIRNAAYQAIWCRNSSPTITNCTIVGNARTGIYYDGRVGNATITNCTIVGNAAIGIYYDTRDDGEVIITNCTITENGYAGISYHGVGNATITNCTIAENGYAGISCYSAGNATITNCTIVGNAGTGIYYGGRVGNAIITDCTITENGYAGISCYSAGNATITNCTIVGNAGGGIDYDSRGGDIIITNCTIAENGYAGIHSSGGDVIITNSTIAGHLGYGIIADNVTITSSIIYYNNFYNRCRSRDDCENIQIDSGSATVTYSNVQSYWPGEGNIDADPCFVNPGWLDDNNTPDYPRDDRWVGGDYHLLENSPCIDAGDPNYLAEPNETDLDGNPRVMDGRVDMGAYECSYVEASMNFTPQTLNCSSKGKWVKAHFVLPEGFVVEDVDANSPAKITEPFEPDIGSDYINVFVNEDGLVEIEAVFGRAAFCGAATGYGSAEVTVSVVGLLTSGQYFYGTDTIRVIINKLQQLAAFATHWLQMDCGAPDWCSGSDLSQDSVVNFIDFAMLDGCCAEVSSE